MENTRSVDYKRATKQEIYNVNPRHFFWRKFFILMGMVAMNNPLSLLAMGILNRLFISPIGSVFILYSASPKYTVKYTFRFMIPYAKSYPVIMGFFVQGGKLGLISGITATESEFSAPGFFEKLTKNARVISRILGVESVNYSGILPSAMQKATFIDEEELERRSDLVATVVCSSEAKVRDELNLDPAVPVIILGGKGSVGKSVGKSFLEQGRDLYVVDMYDVMPEELRGKPAILIDCARKGALQKHMNSFWEGLVILNETYPEPPKSVSHALKEQKIPLYHVTGVKAMAVPRFPNAYAGGIPCCAMNPTSKVNPLIKKLN